LTAGLLLAVLAGRCCCRRRDSRSWCRCRCHGCRVCTGRVAGRAHPREDVGILAAEHHLTVPRLPPRRPAAPPRCRTARSGAHRTRRSHGPIRVSRPGAPSIQLALRGHARRCAGAGVCGGFVSWVRDTEYRAPKIDGALDAKIARLSLSYQRAHPAVRDQHSANTVPLSRCRIRTIAHKGRIRSHNCTGATIQWLSTL
jgi:hypothetical protein